MEMHVYSNMTFFLRKLCLLVFWSHLSIAAVTSQSLAGRGLQKRVLSPSVENLECRLNYGMPNYEDCGVAFQTWQMSKRFARLRRREQPVYRSYEYRSCAIRVDSDRLLSINTHWSFILDTMREIIADCVYRQGTGGYAFFKSGVRDSNGQPDGKGLNIHVIGIKELETELGPAGWEIETPRKHRGKSGNKIVEEVNNLELYEAHGKLPRESGYVSDVRIDRRPKQEVKKLCANSKYYSSTKRLEGYCQYVLSEAGQSAAKLQSTALVGGSLGGFGFGR